MALSRNTSRISEMLVRSLIITLVIIGLAPLTANGQEATNDGTGFFKNWSIKPVAATQFWASYTEGARLYEPDSMVYTDVDGRLNFVLRRTRIGAIIKPNEDITLNVIASMDNIGRDVLAGPTGGVNNGPFPNVGVWNVYVKWRLIKQSEALHVIFGYHSPHFSRESPTAWHAVNSMDKSFSQFYIRRHLTGKNPGRSPGISFGGMTKQGSSRIGLQYTAGLFNDIFTSGINNSAGVKSSPLLTGRVVLFYGDPESDSYKLGYRFNTFSKRKGISIGISSSHQGENDLFLSSYAFSIDLLLNYGPFNLGGEWAWLRRDGSRELDAGNIRDFTSTSGTGFIRASHNFPVFNEQIFELGITYMHFVGAEEAVRINDALSVGEAAGKNTAFDLAAIWHFLPGRIKAELHATFQDGKLGDAGQGIIVNDFFSQSGVGIQRGDYIGVSLIFVL